MSCDLSMPTLCVKVTIVGQILLIIIKNIKFDDLNKVKLLTQAQRICIQRNGQLVSYYYPAIDHSKVEKIKEELYAVMKKSIS